MPLDADAPAFEKRKRSLFEAAAPLSDPEREAMLAHAARSDPALAEAVRRLLTASKNDSNGVLNRPPHERKPPMPSAIGEYAVIRHLGTGGMGTVYLCRNPHDSAPVAVKIIKSALQNRGVREHFERERDVLTRLRHPNVCQMIDASVAEGGIPFIVMEFVDGESLGSYCNLTSCSVERRLLLFSQILAGVEYFHNCHVVHRDLKPSNLFVTTAGNIKILDFGLAKMIDHEKGRTGMVDTDSRAPRYMTIPYASPEQLIGKLSGRASDIYTLSVILYELLTGRHPFPEACKETAQVMNDAIASQIPVPPSHLMRGLSTSLDTLVMNALQHHPQNRYDSAAAFLADVRRYLEGSRVMPYAFRTSS